MMDLFREESVHKVDTGLNTLVFILAWIGLILFGFLALSMLMALFSGALNAVTIGFAISSATTRRSSMITPLPTAPLTSPR